MFAPTAQQKQLQIGLTSEIEIFARRARVDQAVGLCYRKKRNFLDKLTLEKADRPVFCVIGKIWCFVRSHFRPHRKCSVTIFYVCPWETGPYV